MVINCSHTTNQNNIGEMVEAMADITTLKRKERRNAINLLYLVKGLFCIRLPLYALTSEELINSDSEFEQETEHENISKPGHISWNDDSSKPGHISWADDSSKPGHISKYDYNS